MSERNNKDIISSKNKFINKQKLAQAASFIILPAIMYLILGPLEIYYANITEFSFGIKHFLGIFAGLAIAFIVAGSLIISIMPEKMRKIILAIVFAGSALSYVQNMFLNKTLMNQDGSRIDWSLYKGYTVVNTIIWIVVAVAIIVVAIVATKAIDVYRYISIFITLIQLVAVVSVLASCIAGRTEDTTDHTIFSGKEQMVYGNENIIVLILDRYSSGLFEEFYEESPEDIECYLQDFTYYNNADSHYNFTFPALVHLFTGVDADPSMSMSQWTESAWKDEKNLSFYNKLHEAGYECTLYEDKDASAVLGDLKNLKSCYDNLVEENPHTNYGLICRLLEKLTVFRYAPYVIKPRFEMVSNAFKDTLVYSSEDGILAAGNPEFYDRLKNEGISVDSNKDKLFKVLYLQGMHGPCVTGYNGELVEETEDEITRHGLNVILTEYIRQLQETGVYDNATIAIVSDHGLSEGEKDPQPLVLIKRANEVHDAMQIDSAPISHDDFQATVLDLIGMDYSDYGTSIYDWKSGDDRPRELWYPVKGYYHIYEYNTDRDEIIQKIENGNYDEVESILMDKWRLME